MRLIARDAIIARIVADASIATVAKIVKSVARMRHVMIVNILKCLSTQLIVKTVG